MNPHVQETIRKRLEHTAEALRRNAMEAFVVNTKEEVPELVASLLKEGDVIGTGGSETLKECGVMDLLRNGSYHFLDRDACRPEEIKALYRACFSADAYLCSANAVTEQGELYNVDGNSNRVAAICYGPDSVIIVAGFNKLVRNLDEAAIRVKTTAAPPNCMRLDQKTPCRETGECCSLSAKDSAYSQGCSADHRICCNYVISAKQRIPNRIKVILVAESLGF